MEEAVMSGKRVLLAFCAMMVAALFAAPTYAQTTINQLPGDVEETPVQTVINNANLLAPGTSLTSMAGQNGVNDLNQIGPTAYFGVSTFYTINQQAGDSTSIPPSTVTQTAANSIVVNNLPQLALSTVTAGGFQKAANSVNSANFAPNQGSLTDPTVSQGLLTQVVSLATLSATNVMSATALNGVASVIGNNGVDSHGNPIPGYQQASGFLNTAGVLVNVSTTLALQQKMGAPNSITATNTAIANSQISTSATLDPSVLTVQQSSVVGVNQIDFQSVVDSNGAATQTVTNLSGFQPGGLTPYVNGVIGGGTGNAVGLSAVIGNTAAAYTGPTNTATYNIGAPGTGGDGAAVVSGVTQNTVFGLNNITGGAGAGLNLSGLALPYDAVTSTGWVTAALPSTGLPYNALTDGFLQYVDPATIKVQTINDVNAGVPAGVVNLIVARVNNGSAAITGTVRTSASDPTTQSFTNQLNSIEVGGTLYGKATQVALNMDQSGLGASSNGVGATGYSNLAVANANTGPVSLTNVSQNMNQSLNTVSGAYGVDFTLNQAVTSPAARSCTLCSNNIQVAAGTGANAGTISGAQQFISNTVNVAALGGVSGNSTITQTTSNVNLQGVNTLASLNNFNSSISGYQSATTAINVIGK
jgi:hypothetical protein